MNKKITTLLNEYRLSRNNINSNSTIKGEKSYVNIISTCLNDLKIKTVSDLKYSSYNDIVGWFRTNTKSKNSSINKYTSYLKAMLRYFKYNSHPFLLSKKLGDDSSRVIPYHEEDLTEIFRYLRDLDVNANSFTYYALFKLQYATGARVTELLRTKIKNVDLKYRSILLDKTKTFNERFVFWPTHDDEILKKLISENEQKTWLFWNHIRHEPLSFSAVKNFIRDHKDKIGIHFNNRKFRKTFATNFAEATNDDLKTIQVILGHKDIKTTQIYVDRSSQKAKLQYDKIINILPGYNKELNS